MGSTMAKKDDSVWCGVRIMCSSSIQAIKREDYFFYDAPIKVSMFICFGEGLVHCCVKCR